MVNPPPVFDCLQIEGGSALTHVKTLCPDRSDERLDHPRRLGAGMGVRIGQSTKIVDRETGAVMYGKVPAGSMMVAGSLPSKGEVNL